MGAVNLNYVYMIWTREILLWAQSQTTECPLDCVSINWGQVITLLSAVLLKLQWAAESPQVLVKTARPHSQGFLFGQFWVNWGPNKCQVILELLALFGQCSVMSDSLRLPDCSPPGSSVHGMLQARILEWVAVSYSRGPSAPRGWTHVSCVSCIGRQILYHWAIWEVAAHPENRFWGPLAYRKF